MAKYAMQQLPDGVPTASHAAACKALKRLSEALRSDVKVLSGIYHTGREPHRTEQTEH